MVERIVQHIIDPLILLLVAVAVVVFVWGVVEFIIGSESSDTRESGKRHLLWGVIGLVIIVSVFGLIKVIQSTVLELLG